MIARSIGHISNAKMSLVRKVFLLISSSLHISNDTMLILYNDRIDWHDEKCSIENILHRKFDSHLALHPAQDSSLSYYNCDTRENTLKFQNGQPLFYFSVILLFYLGFRKFGSAKCTRVLQDEILSYITLTVYLHEINYYSGAFGVHHICCLLYLTNGKTATILR